MYMTCSAYIRNPKILSIYENTKYTMNTTYMIQVPTETFGSSVSKFFRIQSVLAPEFCFLEDTQQVHIHLEKTLTMCMDASLKGYCACWTGWRGLLLEGPNSLSLFITAFGPERASGPSAELYPQLMAASTEETVGTGKCRDHLLHAELF